MEGAEQPSAFVGMDVGVLIDNRHQRLTGKLQVVEAREVRCKSKTMADVRKVP
jgi:hypothetical protein